jgi:hypothetical protein
MYAVEFKAKIKDGIIELPKRLRGTISDTVKVILLKEGTATTSAKSSRAPDMVGKLLAAPLEIREFHPMNRDEIYAR